MRRGRTISEHAVTCPCVCSCALERRECYRCRRDFDVVATWTARTFVTETVGGAR